MQLIRTTIRLNPEVKKTAQIKAIEDGISFQELVHRAIRSYAKEFSNKKK